jgi:hypothetical protein
MPKQKKTVVYIAAITAVVLLVFTFLSSILYEIRLPNVTIINARAGTHHYLTIPTKCLHPGDREDTYFIYYIETYEAMFGPKSEIRKVDVKVLENNGITAAIASAIIWYDTEIVLEADRPFAIGDVITVTVELGEMW